MDSNLSTSDGTFSSTINASPCPVTIQFCEPGTTEADLVLREGYFVYRGEKIEDIHKAYERFVEWLSSVEHNRGQL